MACKKYIGFARTYGYEYLGSMDGWNEKRYASIRVGSTGFSHWRPMVHVILSKMRVVIGRQNSWDIC